MARITKRLAAIAMFIALATLFPVWAQNAGTVVWTTVPVMFGSNPDGTSFTTEFSFVNRDAVVHTINYTITDTNGNLTGATMFDRTGVTTTDVMGSIYNIPPFSTTREILTALPWTPNAVPSQVNIETLLGSDGLPVVVGSARVVQVDGNGSALNLSSAADSTTIAKPTGTVFGVPAVFGAGYETTLSLSTRVGVANVTIVVRPCSLADPTVTWPTVQLSVGRALTVKTLSQLFPGLSWTETLVTIVSDEPVTVTALQQSLNSSSTVASSANLFSLPALSTAGALTSPAFRPFRNQ